MWPQKHLMKFTIMILLPQDVVGIYDGGRKHQCKEKLRCGHHVVFAAILGKHHSHLRQGWICAMNKGTYIIINSSNLRKYIWCERIVVTNFRMRETNCIKYIFLDHNINKESNHIWNKGFRFGSCPNLCYDSAFVVNNGSDPFSGTDLRTKEN